MDPINLTEIYYMTTKTYKVNNKTSTQSAQSNLNFTKIAATLQSRFEQSVRRYYKGPVSVGKGMVLYDAQVELMYYLHEITQGPECMASQQISLCNAFINSTLPAMFNGKR